MCKCVDELSVEQRLVKCAAGLSEWSGAATSLLPRAHVCVDGHTVVGSVAEFFLTDLSAEKANTTHISKGH